MAVSAASGGVGAGLNGWGAQAFGMTSATNASLVAAANAGFTTLV